MLEHAGTEQDALQRSGADRGPVHVSHQFCDLLYIRRQTFHSKSIEPDL
jgi:hypothetical protein